MIHKPITIAETYAPLDGLTISTEWKTNSSTKVTVFSLGAHTDISAESYDQTVIIFGMDGQGVLALPQEKREVIMSKGAVLVALGHTLFGTQTQDGFIYMELLLERELEMNEKLKAGELFQLKDLVTYKENSIVNMDVASNDQMKFVLMAFDSDTGLSPHRAPGDALVFALEGKVELMYEEKNYTLEAGQAFRFEKNGLHALTAKEPFKMALMILLK